MFTPLVSFLAGLLLFASGYSDNLTSDIVGTWEDMSASGHQIEFFIEGDQLYASSSLFYSPKLIVSQYAGNVFIQEGNRRIEGEYDSDFLVLRLISEGKVESLSFEKPSSLSGSITASSINDVPRASASLGMIKGFPMGRAKSTASIFRVFLFQENQMIGSQVLDTENGFVFSQLPNGSYTVFFEAQGPTAVQPVPAYRIITVQNGDVIEANVVLE